MDDLRWICHNCFSRDDLSQLYFIRRFVMNLREVTGTFGMHACRRRPMNIVEITAGNV